MNKSPRVFFVVLACMMFLFGLPASGVKDALGQEASPERPNVILVLTDDLDVDSMRYFPRLKSLMADRGTTFSNAFVTYSLCCPSRSSILRGQYPHNHQVRSNVGPLGGYERFKGLGHESSTVATWLQSGGYRTALFGTYLAGYGGTYVPPGWDEWYALSGTYDSQSFNENGTLQQYDTNSYNETDYLSDKAADYIRRSAGEKPFFAYIATEAPHQPAIAAQRHRGAFAGVRAPRTRSFNEKDVSDKPKWVRNTPLLSGGQIAQMDDLYRKRLQSMLAVEDMLGRLIGELEASGELDNTYIVFTSDNGYHMGQHRQPSGKRTAYEEDIRVPMVVRGPGVAPGRVEPRMALNNDLAPTFADLAGVPAPSFVDGRSLVPLLKGGATSWRSAFLVENWRSDTTTGLSPIPDFKAMRTGTATYVKYATGEREIYDLRNDPRQLNSLHATTGKAALRNLDSRLSALRTCVGASCRTAEGGTP